MKATINHRKSARLDTKGVKRRRRQLNRNLLNSMQTVPRVIPNQKDMEELIFWKKQQAIKQESQRPMFFFIGLTVALLLAVIAFEWKFTNEPMVDELTMEKVEFDEIQDMPLTQQQPPPPPPTTLQQPVVVEVPDEVILEQVEVDFDVEATEDMVVEEYEFTEEPIEEEVAEEIFLIVEDKPEPVGGMVAFYKYVGENIIYPMEARRMDVQGRVFIQFVVNGQGEITDVHAVKGIGFGCDEEAVRVVSEAPNWHPGKQRGKPVKVRVMIPITFKLANR